MHFLGAKERVVIYRTDEKQASGRADGSEGRAAEVGGWVHSRCYPRLTDPLFWMEIFPYAVPTNIIINPDKSCPRAPVPVDVALEIRRRETIDYPPRGPSFPPECPTRVHRSSVSGDHRSLPFSPTPALVKTQSYIWYVSDPSPKSCEKAPNYIPSCPLIHALKSNTTRPQSCPS